FLGFGVPRGTPSWGRLASEGQSYLFWGQWWWSIMPGITIMVTVLGCNLLGDGLRDALDARQLTDGSGPGPGGAVRRGGSAWERSRGLLDERLGSSRYGLKEEASAWQRSFASSRT